MHGADSELNCASRRPPGPALMNVVCVQTRAANGQRRSFAQPLALLCCLLPARRGEEKAMAAGVYERKERWKIRGRREEGRGKREEEKRSEREKEERKMSLWVHGREGGEGQ
jgi:hypothetical protein